MPIHDHLCPSCGHEILDEFWASYLEVPEVYPCPECGEPMEKVFQGNITCWGPASVWNDAEQDFEVGPGRAAVPGHEIFRGTPLEEAARAGETVNPYLEPDHPGYHKRATHWREYVDLGR